MCATVPISVMLPNAWSLDSMFFPATTGLPLSHQRDPTLLQPQIPMRPLIQPSLPFVVASITDETTDPIAATFAADVLPSSACTTTWAGAFAAFAGNPFITADLKAAVAALDARVASFSVSLPLLSQPLQQYPPLPACPVLLSACVHSSLLLSPPPLPLTLTHQHSQSTQRQPPQMLPHLAAQPSAPLH